MPKEVIMKPKEQKEQKEIPLDLIIHLPPKTLGHVLGGRVIYQNFMVHVQPVLYTDEYKQGLTVLVHNQTENMVTIPLSIISTLRVINIQDDNSLKIELNKIKVKNRRQENEKYHISAAESKKISRCPHTAMHFSANARNWSNV